MSNFRAFIKMIKLEHSLFALPFAFVGMFLAAKGLPTWWTILWVVVAMIGARSAAMGMNRYADAEIDARNPRTASREIPAGNITKKSTIFYICLSLLIYFVAAFMLNKLTAILSPIPILIFVLYAYAKRFTNFCHVILGIALGLAPVCAWIAVTGTIDLPPFILGLAIIAWVAGFDILYAIQDIEYDIKDGVKVKYGDDIFISVSYPEDGVRVKIETKYKFQFKDRMKKINIFQFVDWLMTE